MNYIDRISHARILLAEDDAPNRKVTLLILKRLGYDADAVANGLAVLHALKTKTYDLILMDIVMPQMDGLAATQEIRRRCPESKQPIIIAFTAYTLRNIKERCFSIGMDDFILKPVTMDDLKVILERNLKLPRKLKLN